MSGTLAVSVECGYFGDQKGVLTHLVGNIYATGRGGESRRQVALPLGWDAEPARFDLPAGEYMVEATLPSGQVLTDEVQVPDGGTALAQLWMGGSPFETHVLQYLMGNIEPSRVYHGPETYPVPNSLGSRSFPFYRETARGGLPPPEVVVLSPAADRPLSIPLLVSLLGLRPALAARAVADAAGAGELRPLLPHQSMPVSPLFRVDDRTPGMLASGFTHYLRVSAGEQAYLVALPYPWLDSDDRIAPVEVMLNLRQAPTGSPVSVTVRDPGRGAGLGYLSAGSLDKAAVLFADAQNMLYRKVRNPLAAAAAGYVLTGTESSGREQDWDDWLGNLRDWFPEMSDGAILWGARRLRRAQTATDAEEAKPALLEGYRRGLPVYTLGLTWLIDGLSAFPDDPECGDALQQVRQLCWSVDMREPFVVLRLGRQE